MILNKKSDLDASKELFLKKCYDLVEDGIQNGDFRMKDVAETLGISSQVASKLVNPSNPRTLSAFELLRMSVLLHKVITDIIPLDLYLTPKELKDEALCQALTVTAARSDTAEFTEMFQKLPVDCRDCILNTIRLKIEQIGPTTKKGG